MNRFIVAASTSAWPFFTDVVTWGETLRGVTGGSFRGDTRDGWRRGSLLRFRHD